MAGSLILDDDLLVLQRKGDFDIKDEYYETKFPDQFPNIRIDTDIFHFTGADLRFSVNEYVEDSGRFVLTRGDTMTGNLTIDLGTGSTEKTAQLVLIGNRTGTNSYARINFRNEARSSNRTQSIQAIAPVTSSTQTSHMKIADRVAITEFGQILMSGGRHNVCGLNGGALKTITNASWDTTNNIISNPLETNSTRLRWDQTGGFLVNNNNINLLEWNENSIFISGTQFQNLIEVNSDHANYNATPTDDKHITNKEYVDRQDGKSIPLKGTRSGNLTDLGYTLEQNVVDGPIDFTNDGTLSATANNKLFLCHVNSPKFAVGTDGCHVYNDDIDFHDNRLLNVPDPDTTDLNDPDAKSAVPKRYIDDIVQEMQDKFDGIADIAAPPGMINAYTGTSAPAGWFICNGASYKGKEHPKMHRALGGSDSDYANDPNRTFTLPNLRGRFLAQYGKLRNSNSQPVGSTVRNYTMQTTSRPYAAGIDSNDTTLRDNMTTNTTGSHNHSLVIADHVHSSGNYEIVTRSQKQTNGDNGNDDGAELTDPIRMNKKGDALGSRNSQGDVHIPVEKYSGYAETRLSYNQKQYNNWNNNADLKDGGLTGNIYNSGSHSHYIPADQWDSYTLPYAYTINWIIKHDN